MTTRIYRSVDKVQETWHGQNGRIGLTLECGHTQRRKYSQGVPSRARCLACESVRGGSGGNQFDTETSTRHWQTWDADKKMPVNQSAPMTPAEISYWTRHQYVHSEKP